MTRMPRLLFAASSFLLASAGARAWAQSCNTDTDCPQSFICAVSGTATTPACKGTVCPADGADPAPVVYRSCEPKTCASDADCGTGMVCYESKSTTCSGGGSATSGCAANTKCDAGAVIMTTETCTTTTSKVCAFKWQLPCNADSDCGDAFVCDPTVSGGCANSSRGVSAGPSGTGGAASSGNSSSPPAADGGAAVCPTTTSFPGSCRAKASSCTADSECPAGWTCTAIGTPVAVTGVGSPAPAGGGATAAPPADSVDAGSAPAKICVGPFGAGAPTRGTVDVTSGGQATSSGHQGTDSAVPPASTGGGATGGTTGGASASSGTSGSGCAIAPARADDSTLLLIGLATVGLALGRRRLRK